MNKEEMMRKPLVTYNAETGELRSNPAAFAEKSDYVASILWEKEEGQKVEPGDVLAVIQWGSDPKSNINAPKGCTGTVKRLNRNISYEELEYSPSQFLAQIS